MTPSNPHKRESFYHAALVTVGALGLASEAANRRTAELLKECGTFEEIYREKLTSAQKESAWTKKKKLDKIVRTLEKLPFPFQAVTINSPNYPASLKTVDGNPIDGISPVLYLRGDSSLLNFPSIAVVGTRRLEDHIDISEGERVLNGCIERGYLVVSGLALGCDTLAHKYALEHGGRTVAVLGTPLDRYYPKENRTFQDQIGSDNLLVSPYPISAETFPSYFAHRNSITVGLSSEGVIIIRSDDRSGTQHAVRETLKQGKKLFVLENNLHQGYGWTEKYTGRYEVVPRLKS